MKLTSSEPVHIRPYPIPYAKEEALRAEINYLLQEGIISPSESPYSASVVLLRKPNGEHRLCIDYHQLNRIREFRTLPDQGQLFAKLNKAKYFSKVDLSKGYNQIPVKPEIRPYLAFSTSEEHYEFNVLPFSLSNAPCVFTRMVRKLLQPLQNPSISNYMDNILAATETFEEHLTALGDRLAEVGLTARPTKCMLAYEQLEFLGHTVTQGYMFPDPKNLETLKNASRPQTKKDVRSFVSLCGFY